MIEDIRQRWLKNRYNKKVKVEVEPEYFEEISTVQPLHIIEGLESFEGAQPVEISFENVHNISDIEIDHHGVEIESFNPEEQKMIAWIHDDFTPDTSFYIYYGRNNDWAMAYDDEFKRGLIESAEWEGYDYPNILHLDEDEHQ